MPRISHPGAAGLNETNVFNRTDGSHPLPREVMLVTLSGRPTGGKKSGTARSLLHNDPVSLQKETGSYFLPQERMIEIEIDRRRHYREDLDRAGVRNRIRLSGRAGDPHL